MAKKKNDIAGQVRSLYILSGVANVERQDPELAYDYISQATQLASGWLDKLELASFKEYKAYIALRLGKYNEWHQLLADVLVVAKTLKRKDLRVNTLRRLEAWGYLFNKKKSEIYRREILQLDNQIMNDDN